MKITRNKKAAKRLSFYINNFGFRLPIQVLVDGTFCFAASKIKFSMEEQLKNYLSVELRLLTTPCIIIESEKLGHKLITATKILKNLNLHKCGHEKSPLSGAECIKEMTTKSRFLISTQDRELQGWIRKQPGIALLYLHQVVPNIEEPSKASLAFVANKNRTTATFSELESKKVDFFKQKEGLVKDATAPKKQRKVKGGPNPLSCKKKKDKSTKIKIGSQNNPIEKKKRIRVKIPKHVQEALKKCNK